MRRPDRLLALTLLVAACSGGEEPTQPPSPPGRTATSLAIVAGDGQSAQSGAVLPIKLSVLVKDAAGAALSGVAVQFTVDSGGGSLSAASATSGSNGVAVSGDWTLGGDIGTQVVSAHVGSLPLLRFHAQSLGSNTQTLFNNASVGGGGSTLSYTKAGDPLNGLTLVVPAGAYPTGAQFTVVADSTTAVPLPSGFSQVGPTLVITNTKGYADSAMTLKVPMQVATTFGIAPFYYDPVSHTLEGIPMVDRTATSATLVTHHFSRDLMAIPGNVPPAGAATAGVRMGFGAVSIVWVKVPKSSLVGTFRSGFLAGVDNWEFINWGSYLGPNGDCEGISISEMFYHFFHKLAGEAPLYHHFDLTLENVLDNVQGIRFAGSVQADYVVRFRAGFDQVDRLTQQGIANGVAVDELTSTWILLTLKLTGNPVLLGIRGANGAHAVVAYSATSDGSHTDVRFADPNFPVTGRTMSFDNGHLTPIPVSLTADAAGDLYDFAYALAVSSEIPIISISNRFDEFTQQHAGVDRLPAQYRAEYYDYLSDSWKPLTSTIMTTDADLNLRHICVSCPAKATGGLPDQQPLAIWDAAGANYVSNTGQLLNSPGTTQYYARLDAFTGASAKARFLDAVPFSVTYQPLTLSAHCPPCVVGSVLTVNADAGSLATIGSTYTWSVDDGSPPVTQLSSSFSYTPTHLGPATIAVTLKNVLGQVIAKANGRIIVRSTITLSPSPINASPGTPITITASVVGGIPAALLPSLDFAWFFRGPGGPDDYVLVETPGPAVTHTFPVAGSYTVDLIIQKGAEDTVVAHIQDVPVQVKAWPGAWRFTSFVLQSVTPPSGGLPSQSIAAQAAVDALLAQVVQTPSEGMIFLEDNVLFNEHAVYFQVAPVGQGHTATYYVPGSYFTLLARDASIQFSHYTSTGDLHSGSINGEGYTSSVFGASYVIQDNFIVAQKNGNTMTGTVTIGPYAFGGARTYTFVATLVTP